MPLSLHGSSCLGRSVHKYFTVENSAEEETWCHDVCERLRHMPGDPGAVPSSRRPSLLTPWALGARSWVQQGSYTTVLNLPAEGLDLEREQIHTFPEEKLNEQLLLFDRVKWKPWLLNVCIRCNPSAAPFQKSPALSFTLWARPLVAILSNSESPSKELESVMI